MRKITQLELGLLFCLFFYSTMVGFWIGPLANISSYSGWVVLPIAGTAGAALAGITVSLGSRCGEYFFRPASGFRHYLFQFALLIPALLFFLHLAAYILHEFTDFMAQMYLPTTPKWFLTALFLFATAVAVRSGIDTIVRCASGFFFVVLSTSLIAPMLVLKDLNYNRAIALVTHFKMGPMWEGVYQTIPWFGEAVLLLFLVPRVEAPEKTTRTLILAALGASAIVALYFIFCMLLFGQDVTAHLTYPGMELIRYVRIGDFLENMDPLIEAIWTASIFIKLCMILYTVTRLLTCIIRTHDGRPFSFLVCALVFAIVNQMKGSTTEQNDFFMTSWATMGWIVELWPLLLIAAYYSFTKLKAKT